MFSKSIVMLVYAHKTKGQKDVANGGNIDKIKQGCTVAGIFYRELAFCNEI